MITRLPLLFSLFFVIATSFIMIYLSGIKDGGKSRKKILLYFITGGILIGLTSFIGFYAFEKLPLWIFMAACIWLLAVGILHVWLFEKVIPIKNRVTGEILFALGIYFFGNGLILLLYKIIIKSPFPWIYLSSGLFFLIPTFVTIAFGRFTDIPGRVFKKWSFPPPGTLSDPSDSEMADPVIVNFVIRKGLNDDRTVFKAKAPRGLTLGRLFYYFVIDYNSRYPDHAILISESENNYFKWSFFMTRSVFSGSTHLDPELTVAENKIKDNSSVTCERLISQI